MAREVTDWASGGLCAKDLEREEEEEATFLEEFEKRKKKTKKGKNFNF